MVLCVKRFEGIAQYVQYYAHSRTCSHSSWGMGNDIFYEKEVGGGMVAQFF